MTDDTMLAEAGEATTTFDTCKAEIPPLAWSLADPEAPGVPGQHSWRRAVAVAAGMVIVAALLGTAISTGNRLLVKDTSSATAMGQLPDPGPNTGGQGYTTPTTPTATAAATEAPLPATDRTPMVYPSSVAVETSRPPSSPPPVPAASSYTTSDEAYLAALRNQGISFGDDLEVGRRICSFLNGGYREADIAYTIHVNRPGLTDEQTHEVVADAAAAYCPGG